MEQNNIEIHNNIVKYKGYEFQLSPDKKKIRIGLSWIRIPQPYIYGRNKQYRVDFQFGIDEKGKRIRKTFYFKTFEEALNNSIKIILDKELSLREYIKENKEKILEKVKEELKYQRFPKPERKIEIRKEKNPIKKRGKKWVIFKKIEGKTKMFSFDTYEEAEAFLKQIEREKILKGKRDLTLKEGLEIFSEYFYARKKDVKKLRHFLHFFNPFLRIWGNIEWNKIDETKIENYITERLKDINPKTGQNITEKSVKNELKYLRAVWNFLLKNGYLTGINYADKILKERKFEERKRERVLSYEENIRFLKELIELPNDEYHKQIKGIILIGFFTGARREEIFKLKKENIRIVEIDNEKHGMIYFPANITKTGKERKIDIPYEFALFLLSISKEDLLFPSFQTGYQQRKFSEWFHHEFLKKCGIENFYFHDLRHNWATIAEEKGLSLRIIKELGGWESFDSVNRYINPIKEKKFNPMRDFVHEIIMNVLQKNIDKKILELKEKENEM